MILLCALSQAYPIQRRIHISHGLGPAYCIRTNTPESHTIGFQILAGIGTGFGMQNSLLALQQFQGHAGVHRTTDEPRLICPGTSSFLLRNMILVIYLSSISVTQFLGGTLAPGVAEPVFASQLSKYLRQYARDVPLFVVQQSPTSIYTALPAEMVLGVVHAYTASLKIVFLIGVPVAFLALVSTAFINNLRILQAAPPTAKKKVEGAETI
ncbi:hypothetical protein C8R44DRAFT_894122 [Mycena epipterygia]|nr:hypothetical protein C8R44DRAFT_894122 [Mycena epipterygia]